MTGSHPDEREEPDRVPPPVFIPDIGFRAPTGGLRMAHPTALDQGSMRLTVHHLVSTAAGTELAFEISGLQPSLGASEPAWMRDKVNVRDERGREYGPKPGIWMAGGQSTLTDDLATVRRSMSLEPIDADARQVDLLVRGVVGDWVVPVTVVPLDEALAGGALTASDSRHGITVTLRHATFGSELTALDLEVTAEASVRFVRGLGAMFGRRRGSSRLVLRDDRGQQYTEVDAPTGQPLDPMGRTYVAVFDPLPSDAGTMELRVPCVLVEEADGNAEFDLPVTEPRGLTFGRYPIRVVSSSRVMPRPGAPAKMQQHGIALQLDFGDWAGDRRLIFPGRVYVDGRDHGYNFGPMSPGEEAPATEIQVPVEDPDAAQRILFRFPTVQVRGPWILRFARDK